MGPTRVVRGDGPVRRRPPPGAPLIGPPHRHRWAAGAIAGLLCCAFTLSAAAATESVHRSTERRLLDQKAAEISAVLELAVAGAEAPLTMAAEVAAASNGDPSAFTASMNQSLRRGSFTGAVLLDGSGAVVATAGQPTVVRLDAARRADVVARAAAAPALSVIDTLDLEPRVLGYARSDSSNVRYVVYAESALPARTGAPRPTDAFAGLDYALYLGDRRDPAALLYTSETQVPLDGEVAVRVVPFGDTSLTVAVSSDRQLGGALSSRLPWILTVGGLALSLVIAAVTTSVLRDRHRAESLAGQLADSNHAQRVIIETLQQSLLPRRLPRPPGAELATAYWPADRSMELSGDFFDVFELNGDRWAVAIGDVCGKGVEAAALTGAVRHTIRAAARSHDTAAGVLRAARDAVAEFDDTTFCTACVGFVRPDDDGLVVQLSLAGHPRPVHVHRGGARAVGRPGTILGLVPPNFLDDTVRLEPGDLLLLYTDGVTDAPGGAEIPEDELCRIVAGRHGSRPGAVVAALRRELAARRPGGATDDVALLVIACHRAAVTDPPELTSSAPALD